MNYLGLNSPKGGQIKIWAIFVLLFLPLAVSAQFNPSSGAAYFSNGPGLWAPLTTTTTQGAVGFIPPPVALYCYNTTIKQWVPGDSTCLGGGASFITSLTTNGSSGAASVNAGVLNIPVYTGGSLPTATQPGQIISSTAAGTTYAVQGQVFYSQSGDTIASIESACSSLCTYVVTIPQTFTLAASHVLNSNVNLQFAAGGQWTINGATFTLTIPTQVQGALSQHFVIGTGSLTFGDNNSLVPVEWFGAVGDWNGTTGTDNTTAIQNTLNALTSGQALLQALGYKTTSALSITKSAVGIAGTSGSSISGQINVSRIVTTSASADVIDVAGVSYASLISENKFTNFGIERSLTPTGTAAGLSLSFVSNATINNVTSSDSIRCFYFHAVPAGETGIIEDTRALWGFNGFIEPSGNLYGYYLDSADGNAENSLRLLNGGASNNTSGTTTYGMILTGESINDVFTYEFETAGLSYGQYVVYTGSGPTFATSDIHFVHSVHDDCLISCFFISAITAATNAGVNIDGGRIQSKVSSGKLVDIENSVGVSVIGAQIAVVQLSGSQPSAGIYATGSTGLVIANNTFTNFRTNSILLNNSSDSTITGNNLSSVSGASANAIIALTGSTNNAIVGNSLWGFATTGISGDSSSSGNSISSNIVDPANITTPYAVLASNTTNMPGGLALIGTGANPAVGLNFSMPGLNNDFFLGWGTGNLTGLAGTLALYDATTGVMVWNTNTSDDLCFNTPLAGGNVSGCAGSTAKILHNGVASFAAGSTVGGNAISAPVTNAVSSATGGSGTGTVNCATATCTNLRGSYTVAGGTFATGTLLTLVWPTTTTAYVCNGSVLNNATGASIGYHGVATATGMTFSSLTAATGLSIDIDYACVP